MSTAKKNYGSQNIIFAAIWAVVYIGCLYIIKKTSIDTRTGVIISFLPMIAFAFFIYYFIKRLGSLDEVQIRVQMEAVVIAFSLGLLLLMTLGLLDLVIDLKKENWSYRNMVPYFVLLYFIGLTISHRKYNS